MFIGVKRTDDYGIFYSETFYLLFIPLFSSLFVYKMGVGFVKVRIDLFKIFGIWGL